MQWLIALLPWLLMAPAWACSCAPPPPPNAALEQSAAVFTGVVRRVGASADGLRRVGLQVVDSWRGIDTYYAAVYTPTDTAACGYPFAVDGYYVVYATRDGYGRLQTSLCSRTRPMDARARDEDLAALGFRPALAALIPTNVPAILTDRAMQLPEPRWCVGSRCRGLQLRADGVYLGVERLRLEPEPPPLAGVALYEAAGELIAVGFDGVVWRYQRQGEVFRATTTLQPGQGLVVHELRWTRVPGMLYVLLLDLRPAAEGQPAEPAPQWITLADESAAWQAVPVADPEEPLLGGCYRHVEEGLQLSLAPGQWILVPLPEPLAAPFQSRPYDPVPQAVYVLPGQGIFCRTQGGWSWHAMDGALKHWYSTEGLPAEAWSAPEFAGAWVTVSGRSGGAWQAYRFDESSGRLVPSLPASSGF
jgi:hypothetical protein